MGALTGRLAVVTGASRGIGAAVAVALQDAGATVVRIARSLVAHEENGRIDLPCDLTDDSARNAALDRVLSTGTPDILVNNAGGWAGAPLDQLSLTELDQLIAVNLRVPVAMAQRILPAMRAAGRGRHIAIGSISDHFAFPANAAYSLTKFGLRGLHEVLRVEYAGSGVLSTLVSPGPVDTPLWDPLDPDGKSGFMARRDMLRAEDVAEVVRFVATRPPTVEIDWVRMGPAAKR
ncbi:MAG: SDR family oxidoreductase [Gemmatimonadota bacterium]